MASLQFLNEAREQVSKEGGLTFRRCTLWCALAVAALVPRPASAQVTPAAGYTPPDYTPSVRVGVRIYTDYTYQQNPQSTDSDGNTINPGAFNVSRSYINVIGNVNHLVSFRITPDVTRQ